MIFEKLIIPEVVYILPKVINDERGYFYEVLREKEFIENGINERFVQENQSKSNKGTLRGLHYQKEPYAQGKLVRVLVGEIFDVAVDIRKNSSTYGLWVAKLLSEDNKAQLYIPPGFLHGFYVLSDIAVVNYKCTNYYEPSADGSVRWDDPVIGIKWPLIKGLPINLSEKDKNAKFLSKI